jgi:hypothetical protein
MNERKIQIGKILDDNTDVILSMSFLLTLATALVIYGLDPNPFIALGLSLFAFWLWLFVMCMTVIWVKT